MPFLHRQYPQLRIYQTEQECGDGQNDWRFARYAWRLMLHYLNNGANAYIYWNTSLARGGRSRWGWTQNSLITVDEAAKTYEFTHEYYLLKHFSHFIKPGAKRITTDSWRGYDNAIAFINPDGEIIIVTQNDLSEPLPASFLVNGKALTATLPADSFNTFAVPASLLS